MKKYVVILFLGMLYGAASAARAADAVESRFPKCGLECVAKIRVSSGDFPGADFFGAPDEADEETAELIRESCAQVGRVREAIGLKGSFSQVYAISYMADAGTGLCLNKMFLPWRDGRRVEEGIFGGVTGEKVKVAEFLAQAPEGGVFSVASMVDWRGAVESCRRGSEAFGDWLDSLEFEVEDSFDEIVADGGLRMISLLSAPEGAVEPEAQGDGVALVVTSAMPFDELKARAEKRGGEVIVGGDKPSITDDSCEDYLIVPRGAGSLVFIGDGFDAWLKNGDGIEAEYARSLASDKFFTRAAKLVGAEAADVVFCVSPAAVRALAVNAGCYTSGNKLAEKLTEKSGAFGVISVDDDGVRVTWVAYCDVATLDLVGGTVLSLVADQLSRIIWFLL